MTVGHLIEDGSLPALVMGIHHSWESWPQHHVPVTCNDNVTELSQKHRVVPHAARVVEGWSATVQSPRRKCGTSKWNRENP